MALTKNRSLVWQKHCYKGTALRNDYDLFRPEPGQSWRMAIFIRLQVVLPWLTLNGKGKVIAMPTCRSALTSPAVKKGHSHVSPYPTPKTGHSHTHFVPPWPTLKKGHNHNDKLSFFSPWPTLRKGHTHIRFCFFMATFERKRRRRRKRRQT